MKEIIKKGVSLWLRTIVVVLMCFFICISINVLVNAAFSNEIGYFATATKEGEEAKQYEYLFADGEDTKKAEYEAAGYTVTTQKRTEITGAGNMVFLIVTQLFSTLLTISFVYPNLWQLGTNDSNLVRFKHKTKDIFKGLKIGIVGTIPSFLLYAAFFVCRFVKPSVPIAIYKFLNSHNYSFIHAICGETAGSVTTVGDVAVWRLLLLILPVLIIPETAFVAYYLGFKDISLGEKFIYKKTKN